MRLAPAHPTLPSRITIRFPPPICRCGAQQKMTCKEVVGGHIDGAEAKVCGLRSKENRLRTQNGTMSCMWKIEHYLARPLISMLKLCSIQNRYSISKYPDDTIARRYYKEFSISAIDSYKPFSFSHSPSGRPPLSGTLPPSKCPIPRTR